jgi:hypothetical protein
MPTFARPCQTTTDEPWKMNEHLATFVEMAKAFYGFCLIILGVSFLAITPIVLRVMRNLTEAVTLHANALQGNVVQKKQLDRIEADVAENRRTLLRMTSSEHERKVA